MNYELRIVVRTNTSAQSFPFSQEGSLEAARTIKVLVNPTQTLGLYHRHGNGLLVHLCDFNLDTGLPDPENHPQGTIQ